jgi:hypothetical protein
MGDRAHVIFFDAYSISPTIYLHWHGGDVPDWLKDLRERMTGRFCDASYAAARFVGICHERIPGNLSLGVLSNDFTKDDFRNHPVMVNASPGDAGIIIVDAGDFSWKAFGGYLGCDYGDEQ